MKILQQRMNLLNIVNFNKYVNVDEFVECTVFKEGVPINHIILDSLDHEYSSSSEKAQDVPKPTIKET